MSTDPRLPILKTYKLYIGGAFPRTESGRTHLVTDLAGQPLAHTCQASRKDFRNAVVAARKAADPWQARSAYNRGQILYRMAEMLEGKSGEMITALSATMPDSPAADREVHAAIDRLVAYAGWADKYPQILGCANPVEGPFHNFTLPQACGVVGVLAPQEFPLLGLVSLLAPAICAGNTVVALGSEAHPIATALFGEVCATSDLPAGVVNLLTGLCDELISQFADHRDVDAIHAASCTQQQGRALERGAAENLKRVSVRDLAGEDWYDNRLCQSPYWIESLVEMKTLWHPSAT
jgi:acyl-CoA reductase-like NAD-dependent aldehyde dehydrogenase